MDWPDMGSARMIARGIEIKNAREGVGREQ